MSGTRSELTTSGATAPREGERTPGARSASVRRARTAGRNRLLGVLLASFVGIMFFGCLLIVGLYHYAEVHHLLARL